MGAHTRGPWRACLGAYEFTNSGQRPIVTDAPEGEMAGQVALVTPVADRKRNTPYDAPDPERDANARLIAAAPELLATATALRNAQREYMADRGNEEKGRAVADAATSLDAAITKATGQP